MWKRGWIKRGIRRGNGSAEQLNGRAEGERAKQLEIAKNLIKLGLNIDDIVKATGLSKEEIEKISKEK